MLTRRRLIIAAPGLLSACATQASTDNLIKVTAKPGSTTGEVAFEGQRYPCMLGRSGIVSAKHEGDGGTPAGVFPLRRVYYRPDRLVRPGTALRAQALSPNDGWCDASGDPNYNKPVVLPYAASAEALWRQDGAYDVFAVIGYNDAPIVPGAGSAIFLHVIRQDGAVRLPTAGCVALEREHLLELLSHIRRQTQIRIG